MPNHESMTTPGPSGRTNQKLRTRTAILQAAADLMRTGREIGMLEVARVALVSEATAYRYFPDLASLLQEAMAGQMPTPAEALREVADSRDPVERVAAATEHLLRTVLSFQGATRAMIAATVTRPARVDARPGLRFGLIQYALAPLDGVLGAPARRQLENDLAVVMSAEALFCLTDMCGLEPEAAIASVVHTATTLTRAATGL